MTESSRAELGDYAPTLEERTEAARLLIRMGRSWLRLSAEDVERGARAVALDPHYGAEIASSALCTVDGWGHPPMTDAVKAAVAKVRAGWTVAQGEHHG
jgi:hypothetical protein